jgi:hypothetical protein
MLKSVCRLANAFFIDSFVLDLGIISYKFVLSFGLFILEKNRYSKKIINFDLKFTL